MVWKFLVWRWYGRNSKCTVLGRIESHTGYPIQTVFPNFVQFNEFLFIHCSEHSLKIWARSNLETFDNIRKSTDNGQHTTHIPSFSGNDRKRFSVSQITYRHISNIKSIETSIFNVWGSIREFYTDKIIEFILYVLTFLNSIQIRVSLNIKNYALIYSTKIISSIAVKTLSNVS